PRTAHLRHPHSFPTRRSSDLSRGRGLPLGSPSSERGLGSPRSPRRSTNRRGGGSAVRTPPATGGRRPPCRAPSPGRLSPRLPSRSEEHTSELQSRGHLVCRLL